MQALVLAGTILNVVTYIVLALIPNETDSVSIGIIGYLLVGLAYSFFTATVWPCVPYMVSDKTRGTAVGIAYCFQACGVSIGSFFIGMISTNNKTANGKIVYKWVFFYLAGAALLATIAASFLAILDLRRGGVLFSKNPKEVLKRIQEEKENQLKSLI